MPFNSGSRRDLLGDTIGKWLQQMVTDTEQRVVVRRYFRPPGALPEVGFLAACTRCGACLPVCPPQAIRTVPADGGFAAGTPFIEPAVQPCTVCPDMPCVRACPTGALTLPSEGWRGYRLASLELLPERCVTYRGTPCRVCADSCPIGETALAIDDTGHPVIRIEGCVGCGVCVKACITSPSSLVLTSLEA